MIPPSLRQALEFAREHLHTGKPGGCDELHQQPVRPDQVVTPRRTDAHRLDLPVT